MAVLDLEQRFVNLVEDRLSKFEGGADHKGGEIL